MLIPFGVFSAAGAGGGAAAGAYELISSQILTGTAASVTFSSIPSTYKHIEIRMTAKSNDIYNQVAELKFNSDSAANYSYHTLEGDGSAVTSTNQVNSTYAYGGTIDTNSVSGAFSAHAISILEYANSSKFKTVRALSGFKSNNSRVRLASSNWRNTNAISSITISAYGNFQTGSRFSLYGIKG